MLATPWDLSREFLVKTKNSFASEVFTAGCPLLLWAAMSPYVTGTVFRTVTVPPLPSAMELN